MYWDKFEGEQNFVVTTKQLTAFKILVYADNMLNFHVLSKQRRKQEYSNENSSVCYLPSLWGHYTEQAENIPLIIEVDWNIFQLLCLHAKHILAFQSDDWKKVKTNSPVQFSLDVMEIT